MVVVTLVAERVERLRICEVDVTRQNSSTSGKIITKPVTHCIDFKVLKMMGLS